MSDQPKAETSTDKTQYSQETDIHAAVGFEPAIRKRAAGGPRLRWRGHWHRPNLPLPRLIIF